MKNATLRWLLPLLLVSLVACGERIDKTLVATTEAKLKKTFEETYKEQKIQVKSVTPTPVAGIYELVLSGSQIIYMDANANYFFSGELIDLRAKKSITQERIETMNTANFNELPLENAIKEVRGKGTLKLVVFSDPDCPYCKELEKVMAQIDDLTIYTFMMPIEALHPQAKQKSIQIWCSENPTEAWTNWMRKNITPAGSRTCQHPIEEIIALGDSLGFTGTPTLIFPNGVTQAGYAPKDELLKLIQENQN